MFHLQKENKARKPCYSVGLAIVLLISLFVAGFLCVDDAQALRVSMKRIIFEGSKRSDIITIMNNTAKAQTYRLGLRHYRMEEDRSLRLVENGDDSANDIKWADKMIRYAPRRVTVPPGGSQQIRLLLRRPRDLEAGEYRSHLWIVTEMESEAFNPDKTTLDKNSRSVRLSMQPAITMPMFVRHGDLKASASITDVTLSRTDRGGSVAFVLHRKGNRSLYGDLKVICTGGTQEYVAHHIRGIAIYTEVSKRLFDYDFTYPNDRAQDCSRVRVEYIADRSDKLYGGKLMAQAGSHL